MVGSARPGRNERLDTGVMEPARDLIDDAGGDHPPIR
jgi:hypothetical protein